MATPIPQNDASFTLSEIAHATGGVVRRGGATRVVGVTTDSRSDVAGKLFIALEGERFDGHAFVADVAARGAAAVVVRRDIDVPEPAGVLRVQSTLEALGSLARQHRRRWGGRLVAIGGSAGKTTTKSAVFAVLDALAPGAVHVSPGNLNNLVGVPMVLLGLAPTHKLAVIEIGTNQRGEVAKLAGVSQPDVALVTLIGIEHAEGIGDLDAIEAEEGDLFRALGPAGVAIGNADDERVQRQMDASAADTRKSYGLSASADYRVIERSALGLERSAVVLARPVGGPLRLETRLLGKPGALAVAAAVAVAEHVARAPLTQELVQRGLDRLGAGEPGRLRALELADGSVIVDDTYNANPASVLSAVQSAQEIARSRRARLVLVLGEMRELGPLSRSEHEKLGRALASSGAEFLLGIAGDAELIVKNAPLPGTFVADAAQALALLSEQTRPGDVILVKASRGVRAERVVEALVREKGGAR
jgi:UDP-N-acetylmuramoyl-tripeptide--D-alanyl-D-alanine ligase